MSTEGIHTLHFKSLQFANLSLRLAPGSVTSIMINITISHYHLDGLQKQINKLNRKAVKLGIEPFSVSVVSKNVVDIGTEDSPYCVEALNVEVSGPQLMAISGWTFGAKISFSHDSGESLNVYESMTPFAESLRDFYSDAKPTCCHCNQNRARSTCFVVLKGDEHKLVGSSCLKDFLGHDPYQMLRCFDLYAALRRCCDEFNGDFGRERSGRAKGPLYDLKDVAVTAMDVIAKHGYQSSSDCKDAYGNPIHGEVPTYKLVMAVLDGYSRDINVNLKGITVDEVLESWETLAEVATPENGFAWNVMLMVRNGKLPLEPKWIGLATGALNGTVNHILNASKLASIEALGASDFIGQIGARDVYELEVDRIHVKKNDFGTMTIVSGRLAGTGHKFVTFYSGTQIDFEVGSRYLVKASIKDHTISDKYGKQTILGRVAPYVEKPKKVKKEKAALA